MRANNYKLRTNNYEYRRAKAEALANLVFKFEETTDKYARSRIHSDLVNGIMDYGNEQWRFGKQETE